MAASCTWITKVRIVGICQACRRRLPRPLLGNSGDFSTWRYCKSLQVAPIYGLWGVMDVVLLENALLPHSPQGVTRVPKHIGGSTRKLINLPKWQERSTEVPHMDDGVFAIIRRGELCALVNALFVVLIGPVRWSPARLVDWERCVQDVSSFLAAASDGEVPDLDRSIDASTD
jgi:hypothetical protein